MPKTKKKLVRKPLAKIKRRKSKVALPTEPFIGSILNLLVIQVSRIADVLEHPAKFYNKENHEIDASDAFDGLEVESDETHIANEEQ